MGQSQQSHRKDEHLFIASKFHQQSQNGLADVQLLANNLPELSVNSVDISTTICQLPTTTPFFINAMTGGSPQTDKINAALAQVAAKTQIAMAVGSQSVAIKEPKLAAGFANVRALNPNGIILGNVNASFSLGQIKTARQMIDADAMQLHINVAQELVMPEGDRDFMWQSKIAQAAKLKIPIMVKEVGFGITPKSLATLAHLGVKFVDLSGRGGTNFIQIENERRKHKEYASWQNLGMTTAQTLVGSKNHAAQLSLTASGGITSAVDVVKCLALGADNVGVSAHFLMTLQKNGVAGLIDEITSWQTQIKKLFVLLGVKNIAELHQLAPVILHNDLAMFASQIKAN